MTLLFLNHKQTFKLMVHYRVRGLHKQNDTRFGSHFLSWKCFEEALPSLRVIVETPTFISWLERQDRDKRHSIAGDVESIVKSQDFRVLLNEAIKVFEKAYSLLRQFDTNKACVGLVYHSCVELDNHLKTMDTSKFKYVTQGTLNTMHTTFMNRWEKMESPIHAITYVSLNAEPSLTCGADDITHNWASVSE